MPDCVCGPFAPTQVYLAVTITVAAVAWLLRVGEGWELPPKRTVAAGILIGYQLVCELVGADFNITLHRLLVLGFLLFVAILILISVYERVGAAPSMPPGSILNLT